MDKKQNFQNLKVWKKAVELSIDIYKMTNSFPKEEIFGLTNQTRRCSVSIASNIAEGAARYSKSKFKHFLSIAIGSVAELKTQLIISNEIGYMSSDKYNAVSSKFRRNQ